MTRLLFATDIRGSEMCWKKLLRAGKAYDADVIVLGGNIAAKGLHFLVKDGNAWTTRFMGKNHKINSTSELRHLEQQIRAFGYAPCRVEPDELKVLQDDATQMDALYDRQVKATLTRWFAKAASVFANSERTLFLMPGNADPLFVEDLLPQSEQVIWAHRQTVQLDGRHQMVSEGHTHRTIWDSLREMDDDDLFMILEQRVSELDVVYDAVFNFHAPPMDSGIDLAPVPAKEGGDPNDIRFAPAGSRAVRRLIEMFQPMLSLHGLVPANRRFVHIGRTLCLNPGNCCVDGILSAFLVVFANNGIGPFQFVQG